MIITEENNVSGIDFQAVSDLFPGSSEVDLVDRFEFDFRDFVCSLDIGSPSRTNSKKPLKLKTVYRHCDNFLEISTYPELNTCPPVKYYNWRHLKDVYFQISASLIPLPFFHQSYLLFVEQYSGRTLRNRYKRLQRICQATHKSRSSFLTLTFDEKNYSDWETNKLRIASFLKNFRRMGLNQYFWVAEFGTETKRAHFHIVLFNCPYIKRQKIRKWWKFGNSWIEECRSFGRLSYYLSKYVSKKGGWKVPGKGYSVSQSCLEPVVSFSFPLHYGRSKFELIHYYNLCFYKEFQYRYSLWEKKVGCIPYQQKFWRRPKGSVLN